MERVTFLLRTQPEAETLAELDTLAKVAQDAFRALKSPIQMVTAPHTPVPFSPALEDLYIPTAAKITEAVQKTMAS